MPSTSRALSIRRAKSNLEYVLCALAKFVFLLNALAVAQTQADVNLYRLGAGVLTTDDSLSVKLNLTAQSYLLFGVRFYSFVVYFVACHHSAFSVLR